MNTIATKNALFEYVQPNSIFLLYAIKCCRCSATFYKIFFQILSKQLRFRHLLVLRIMLFTLYIAQNCSIAGALGRFWGCPDTLPHYVLSAEPNFKYSLLHWKYYWWSYRYSDLHMFNVLLINETTH